MNRLLSALPITDLSLLMKYHGVQSIKSLTRAMQKGIGHMNSELFDELIASIHMEDYSRAEELLQNPELLIRARNGATMSDIIVQLYSALVRHAIYKSDSVVLKWVLDKYPQLGDDIILRYITEYELYANQKYDNAEDDKQEFLEYLLENYKFAPTSSELSDLIYIFEDPTLLKLLIQNNPDFLHIQINGKTAGEILSENFYNNFGIQELLVNADVKIAPTIFLRRVLQNGSLDLLKKYDEKGLVDLNDVLDFSKLYNIQGSPKFTPEIYDYILNRGIPINFNDLDHITNAIKYAPNIDTARYILQKNPNIVNLLNPFEVAEGCDVSFIQLFQEYGMVFSIPDIENIKEWVNGCNYTQKEAMLKYLTDSAEYKAALQIQDLQNRRRTRPLITRDIQELTEWGEICMHLDSTYRLDELTDIAEKLGLVVPDGPHKKRALCAALASDYEKYKGLDGESEGVQDYRCHNDPIIEDDYNLLPPDQIIRFTEDGKVYCFSREEFKGIIESDNRNPYTRAPIPESAMKQYYGTRDTVRDSIHSTHAITLRHRGGSGSREQLRELLGKISNEYAYTPETQILEMTPAQVTRLAKFFEDLGYTDVPRAPVTNPQAALVALLELALAQREATDVGTTLHTFVEEMMDESEVPSSNEYSEVSDYIAEDNITILAPRALNFNDTGDDEDY